MNILIYKYIIYIWKLGIIYICVFDYFNWTMCLIAYAPTPVKPA